MSPTQQYTVFWLYTRRANRERIADEAWTEPVDRLFASYADRVTLRGAYSGAGISNGSDLILWVHATDIDEIQRLAVDLGKTVIGSHLELRQLYLGVASVSQYDPNHGPAFMRGLAPKNFLSLYPFTKTPGWFLLPFERRRELMVEHGKMGQEFPSILTNTVNSFGVGDQEFIVALEDDSPATLVAMVQRLRAAAVREYTQIDTPVYLGRLKPVAEILTDLLS
jgi:chlorite dismutase